MKYWKRLTAGMLAAMMAVCTAGCGKAEGDAVKDDQTQASGSLTQSSTAENAASEGLDWLNTSGELPIVKEGTEKTLEIAVNMSVDSGNPEDMWFYKFVEENMNINLEVTKFTTENMNEFLSLAFADNDLPDIIIGGQLTTNDLVVYGSMEKQIMDLAPYITEELTPNLYAIYAEHPEYKTAVTDSEGHVWSLGYINDPTDRGQIVRGFLNYDWLEEAGLAVPDTLEAFIDALRAFKERGEDIVPLGGSYTSDSPLLYILNAFGYNTNDPKGLSIALRNGKVVLPVADREAYGAYLETVHTMYEEGLMHPDFFSMDSSTANAIKSEDRVGFLAQAPFVYKSDFSAWWGAVPLTSEYNAEPMWPASSTSVTAGQFVVSSQCEDPELAMVFADWFFKQDGTNYELATSGPASTQTEYLYDVKGFTIDPETKAESWVDVAENSSLYANKNDYLKKKIMLLDFKVLGLGNPNSPLVRQKLAGWAEEDISDGYPDTTGMEDPSTLRETLTNGEMHFRISLQETMCPYVQTTFPGYVYLDPDTAEEAVNLLTLITEYAEKESAKFITGQRSLDELDAYFDEIERLGALEYVEIYQTYYDNIQ